MSNFAIMILVVVISLCICVPVYSESADAISFQFGKYIDSKGKQTPVTWYVKNLDLAGPGPNRFSNDCVKINRDKKGKVTSVAFNIKKTGDIWNCAEVFTRQRFGLGIYEFDIEGRLDNFDKNIVLGMFSYPTADVGPDGTHEIDIEFSTFGGGKDKGLCYGLCPIKIETPRVEQTFDPSSATRTIHRYNRTRNCVYFASYNLGRRSSPTKQFAKWSYTAVDNDPYIQDKSMPVHINLWLFQGHPPTNGAEVQIILRGFTFKEPSHRRGQ